jgi:phospholipid transport system substrate-binding protein
MRPIKIPAGLLIALLFGFWAQPLLAGSDPVAVVKDTSDKMLAQILSRKQELNAEPSKIYPLVENIVLPHFDFARMSQLVLARHWREASAEQKDVFIREFRELLTRTYATALLNYSGQSIEYQPFSMEPNATRAEVNTVVRENGSPPLPIDYKLYLTNNEWKVYDVIIDKLSLVANYRTNYDSKIRRYGLDGLIEKLVARNNEE